MDLLNSLLASAYRLDAGGEPSTRPTHLTMTKVVSKHWGQERWLVAEGSPFGFKLITIQAGKQTSLQYHDKKAEANLILCGEGRLYIAPHADASLDEHKLIAGQIVNVRPGVVHRIEAVTDLLLVEVSTPELDDVIRLEDDIGRGNGRIESEHMTVSRSED